MSNKGFKGFILAEVLITLGIIGVVAAMTMPTLVQKHKEKQRVAQLKKVYSILNQAYLRAKSEYGEIKDWGIVTSFKGEYIDGERVLDHSGQALVAKRLKEFMNAVKSPESVNNKFISLDGSPLTDVSATPDRTILLSDGTSITIGFTTENCASNFNQCGDVSVTLPKHKKIPQTGVDNFWFFIAPNEIKPYGLPNASSGTFERYCNIKSTITSTDIGRGCTAWVLINENMDYLHCDDLAWDGKHKCK